MAPRAGGWKGRAWALPFVLLRPALVADPQADYVGRNGLTVNQPREPIFNIPSSVVATVALLGLVHAIRELVLTPAQAQRFLLLFAFIPARYDASMLPGGVLPGGWGLDPTRYAVGTRASSTARWARTGALARSGTSPATTR